VTEADEMICCVWDTQHTNCKNWYKKFREEDSNLKNRERRGQLQKSEDEKQQYLNSDRNSTQAETRRLYSKVVQLYFYKLINFTWKKQEINLYTQ